MRFNKDKYEILHLGQQQLVIEKLEILPLLYQVLGHAKKKHFCNLDEDMTGNKVSFIN